MLTWFRARGRTARTAAELYGSIVARAREVSFYRDFGVPDSLEGRYGLIVLHMWLVMDNLRRFAEPGERLARALAECFVTDMDDNMREIGVGDLSVPRKVKKAAAGLYDRTLAYRAALPAGETAIADLLGIHLGLAERQAALQLARYVTQAREGLAALPGDRLQAGHITFVKMPTLDDKR